MDTAHRRYVSGDSSEKYILNIKNKTNENKKANAN